MSALRALGLSLALLAAPRAFAQSEEPDLAAYRDRFKQGLDRYAAADIAGALSFWEPLFHDLGPRKGYRVGYNLARAYEVLGDATRAAERYQSFLDEVKARRQDGFTLDPEVTGDETQAAAHLEELARSRGRIHVAAATPPESVRIDQTEARLAGFVAYVAPGAHDVIFAPGSTHEHTEHVTATAGQVVEVTPPVQSEPLKPPPPIVYRDETRRPFWAGWVWIAGGATVVASGLTALAYVNATALYNRAIPNPTAQQRTDYSGAQTLAYGSWAAPITCAVVTAVLAVVYIAATKHVKIPVNTALAF